MDAVQTAEAKQKRGFSLSLNDALFAIGVIAIILVTIYYRVPMLHFFGFYEPDGYFHFSVIRAAVLNNFVVPKYLSISGWPGHNPISEPFGLYWITLAPYALLQFFGVSYYDIMRLIPVLFGIFDVIGAYLLSRYLSRDRLFGLLVMLFVALNMGNAARTSALIYRGDSFVTAFLIVSLILAIEIFRTESRRRKVACALASGVFLGVCDAVWNGGSFATAVYAFAFALIVLAGFALGRRKLIQDSKYLLAALLAFYLLVQLLMRAGIIISEPTFAGMYFFLLFFAMALGWLAADYLSKEEHPHGHGGPARFLGPLLSDSYRRFAFAIAFILLAILLIYLVIPGFVYQIFVANGFAINSSFASTIQELQPPTPQFIFASFSLQTYLTPMGLLVMASTYAPQLVDAFWGLLLLAFVPYFFMRIYDSKGFAGGKARPAFDLDAPLLVLVALFALTAYLQMHAIRFNSLLSVPLSIFSAYTVYWLAMYCKRQKFAYLAAQVLLAALAVSLFFIASQYIVGLYPADNINPQFIQAMAWMRNNTPGSSVVLTLWPDGSLVEGIANRTSVTDSVGSQNASKANPFGAWLFNSSPDPGFLTSSINGRPDYLVVRTSWMLETGGIYTESNISANASDYGYDQFTGINEKVNDTAQVFTFYGSGLTEVTELQKGANGTQSVASYLISNRTVSPFPYVYFYDMSNGNFSVVRQTAFNQTNDQAFLIVYSSIPSQNLYVNITDAYLMTSKLLNSNFIKLLFLCNNHSCTWNNNIAGLRMVYVNPDTKIFRIVYNESR